MLTDAELAAMRETAEEALPDSAVIYRKTRVSDGGGGGSVTWSPSGTVDARFAPTSGTEALRSFGPAAEAEGTVTVPSATDVTALDRVAVGSNTFEILAVLAEEAWTIAKRLAVKKVR